MYTFFTIDTTVSHNIDLNAFLLNNALSGSMDTREGNQPEAYDFDLLITGNASIIQDAMKAINIKPKLDLFKYEETLEDIAEYLEIETANELFQTISSKDVFIDIDLYNKFKYKELCQLLAGLVMYISQNKIENKEITICIDNDSLELYSTVNVDLLVTTYLHKYTDRNDILIMPAWARLARIAKSMKC